MGMKVAGKHQSGNESLVGKKVLVQGAGHVGQYLVDLLVKEGAKVIISDIHDDKVAAIIAKHPSVQAIAANDVYEAEMDIYSPCALGATVNDETLAKLKCSIIAGAANHQLANEQIHG